MKNLKNQKGITLVALVVTIIVLLILAGVSLSLVAGGNGILNRSVTAVDKTHIASAKEAVQLEIADLMSEFYEKKYVDKDSTVTEDSVGEYIARVWTAEKDLGDYKATLSSGTMTVTGKGLPTDGITGDFDTETGKIEWTGVAAEGTTTGGSTNTTPSV